jgi:hypothetical protein
MAHFFRVFPPFRELTRAVVRVEKCDDRASRRDRHVRASVSKKYFARRDFFSRARDRDTSQALD